MRFHSAISIAGLAVWLLAGAASVPAMADSDPIVTAARHGEEIRTRTQPIRTFEIGSDRTRFGRLTFVGGLEVAFRRAGVGGMSSIRVASDRDSFIGVMDIGNWYSGRFTRDGKGRLSGLADFRIAPIRGKGGDPIGEKWLSDAESIAVRKDGVLVGFEREHRIDRYPLDDPQGSGPVARLPLPFPIRELRRNRSLETVAVSPEDSPLHGATVTVSELSINTAGDIYAGILDGPKRGTFFVRRHKPYAVSDGAFLPNGDLLLLQRGITVATALQVRIERIRGADIKPGATVDGKVIFEAGTGDQIDNLEGLSANRGKDGAIYLMIVSDDNTSILQRNIFLEFRLDPQ